MLIRRYLLASSAIMAALPGLCAAQAIPAPAVPAGGLEEIVVTAEHRESNIQKTAINITAIDGAALEEHGITSSRDVLDSIPGLKLTVANPNAYIGLYGFGSGGGSQYSDGVMTFNYGGIPLARQVAATSSYYDLERLEVLKGPQGTLYGRNATVGAINVDIARPKDTFSANLSTTIGNYAAVNTTGYVNVPLNDQWATRVAFQTTRHDGYFTNGYDDANNYGARGSIQYKPNDDVTLLLWTDGYFNRSKGPYTTFRYYSSPSQEFINPSNPWFGLGAAGTCTNFSLCPTFAAPSAGGINTVSNPLGFTNTGANGYGNVSLVGQDGKDNIDQVIISPELDWRTPIGALTLIAAHVYTKIDFLSYSGGLQFFNKTTANQDSIEARLASTDDGPLKWTVGAFYFNESQNAFQNNLQSTGWAELATPNLTDMNYAGFADGTYSVLDNVRITAGARWTHEEKTQDGYTTASGLTAANMTTITQAGGTCYAGATPTNPILFQGVYYYPSNFCSVPNNGLYKKNNVSWKAGVEGDVTPSSMLYANVRTGFRAGGFTVGTGNVYKPEELTAYEIGSKNRFFDRKLQVNLTGFYWDYKNQQISQLQLYYLNGIAIGQTAYPSNFNGYLEGAELDAQALVTHHDRITSDIVYAKGAYDSTPPVATLNTTALLSQTNLPRVNLPKWTLTGSYEHTFEFDNGATIIAGARAHYESRAVLRILDPNLLTPGEIRNSYAKLDLDVTYNAPDEKWSIQGFVKNVTNVAVVGVGSSGQVALPTFFRLANEANLRTATLDPPRTFGARLNYNF